MIFWDVDGDRVNNALGQTNYTDIASNPPEPQEANGDFPNSELLEELYEMQSVFNASNIFAGSAITRISSPYGHTVLRGNGPGGYSISGNVPTDFSSNPYVQLSSAFAPTNEPAIGIYQLPVGTTGFKMLVGSVSGVGRQYRSAVHHEYGERWSPRSILT